MANFRLSDVLPRYDGYGDISTWIKQAELAKVVMKLESLVAVIPICLDGDAFNAYDNMPAGDKENEEKIKALLLKTFAIDMHSAFDQLVTRSWTEGESVDVYLADLKRLAKLADVGQKDAGALVKLTFIRGLPRHIAAQVRAMPKVGNMTINEILEVSKALMIDYRTERRDVGAAVAPARTFILRCFTCGGPHMKRFCPQAKPVVCYNCRDVGHIARNCRGKYQGNGSGMQHAPARVPGMEEAQ